MNRAARKVFVKKGMKYKAAIEVREHKVIQARSIRNGKLDRVRGLEQAVRSWMNKFGLQMVDEDWDLPF